MRLTGNSLFYKIWRLIKGETVMYLAALTVDEMTTVELIEEHKRLDAKIDEIHDSGKRASKEDLTRRSIIKDRISQDARNGLPEAEIYVQERGW